MLEIFGKRATRRRCSRAMVESDGNRGDRRELFGASFSAFGSSTAKKFGSNRPQFTSRRLVSFVGTITPCTSHVMMSPSLTCSSCAGLCSSESSEQRIGQVRVPEPFSLDEFLRRDDRVANVERNSRRSAQLLADIALRRGPKRRRAVR